MKRTKFEYVDQLTRPPGDHAYDGVITAVFDDHVHVRLAGSPRRVLRDVLIPDLIRQNRKTLRPGLFCKISSRYERDGSQNKQRFILTDILPQFNCTDVAGQGTNIPKPPSYASADASCPDSEWTIRWSEVPGATSYQIFWATNPDGIGPTQIAETSYREHQIAFDTGTPPRVYFAVRAISGVEVGELSAWVTDPEYLLGMPIITFGDDYHHGHITPVSYTRWRVSDGIVQKSLSNGANWLDIPPGAVANTWGDGTPPTIDDVSFIQVLGNDSFIVTLGKWEAAGPLQRGSMWLTLDNGGLWTECILRSDSQDELMPIWADMNSTYLFVTLWQRKGGINRLKLQRWTLAPFSFLVEFDFGEASLTQVENRTRYLFPVADPGTDVWHVAGNFWEIP
jgi:hypothetical protein